jgi:hypothetical protein
MQEGAISKGFGHLEKITGYPRLWSESHFLVWFALVVTTDLDCHLPVKPFQKVEQLVRREAAKMPIHQVRHVRLRNTEDAGDFLLFEFLVSRILKTWYPICARASS